MKKKKDSGNLTAGHLFLTTGETGRINLLIYERDEICNTGNV